MKILVCCGSGLGSSFMIEMNIQNILNELGVNGIEVSHSDLSSAKGMSADIYVSTRDLSSQLEGLGGEVISLNNMIDMDELKNKLLETLKKLNIEDKIIIIATHKNIYDELANVILRIDYGQITVQKESLRNQNSKKDNTIPKTSPKTYKMDFLFIKRRKKIRIFLGILTLLLFFAIFSGVSIIKNIRSEYIKNQANVHPLHVIEVLDKDTVSNLTDVIQKQYENYQIEENGYKAYILLDKEDSLWLDDTILVAGEYPSNENEIIVNEEFAGIYFENLKNDEIIGKSIVVKDQNFIIAGIIHHAEYDNAVYQKIPFYRDIESNEENSIKPAIFIPYKKMQENRESSLPLETFTVLFSC